MPTPSDGPLVSRLQVACSTENEYQRHPGHEWGFVLEGQLEVKIGFEEYILGSGDSGSFDSTVPHRLANADDVPVHAIWFVLGRIPGGIAAADTDRHRLPAGGVIGATQGGLSEERG